MKRFIEIRTAISLLLILLAVFTANLSHASFSIIQQEQQVIFTITFFLFVLGTYSIFQNIYTYKKYGTPRDIWKLGLLGVLGFAGLSSSVDPIFLSGIGLIGLLSFKKELKPGQRFTLIMTVLFINLILGCAALLDISKGEPNLATEYALVASSIATFSTVFFVYLKHWEVELKD